MIDDFDRAWRFTHSWECWGGESSGVCRVASDPRDPGGDTIHGIARRFNPDVWRDGPPDMFRAGEVAYERYWKPAHCGEFAWPLNLVIFDWCFHSGEDNPAEALQRLVGAKVDGDIGPRTVVRVHEWAARQAATALVKARRAQLLRHPDSGHFRGWFRRLTALEALVV